MHAFISPFGQVSLCATELSRNCRSDRSTGVKLAGKGGFFLVMVPKKKTKSTSSWMKIEQCISRVERKGWGRGKLWERVALAMSTAAAPRPPWPLLRSTGRQGGGERWDFFFFDSDLRAFFLGRFLSSVLPDLQPRWVCSEELLEVFLNINLFLGVQLIIQNIFWENRTGGEKWEMQLDLPPALGWAAKTGSSFCLVFFFSFVPFYFLFVWIELRQVADWILPTRRQSPPWTRHHQVEEDPALCERSFELQS